MAETVFTVTDDETIPAADRPYVNRLRRFLQDQAVLNTLEQVQESTNVDLYFALQDALDEVNTTGNYTEFSSFTQIPWSLLKIGATLNILLSQGILSARNQLTYNDQGGIMVSDVDKYGRYVNWFNILTNKFQRGVIQWKITKNVDDAYGEIPSEYVDLGDA